MTKKSLSIICILIIFIVFTIVFNSCSKNTAQDKPATSTTTMFPYEKAKGLALSSIEGGSVIGYCYEGNAHVTMYLFGQNGSRWQREFSLLTTETGPKWLMIAPPFGSLDAKFTVIE